ncbi:hypothetical protein KBY81_15510, partial [Cyanobium sp. Lug-B]|nr:hypothetical protein [Cyanobium sp. Lug-B]
MHVQVRLLHCDGGRRVVLVSARDGERFLGSALGEAGDAEEAEDRARARLLAHLQGPGPAPEAAGPAPAAAVRAPAAPTPPVAPDTPAPRSVPAPPVPAPPAPAAAAP